MNILKRKFHQLLNTYHYNKITLSKACVITKIRRKAIVNPMHANVISTPLKNIRTTFGFLTFLGGIEMEHWHALG